MHKREASRQSSLRAAISEQLKRLIENLALPVPELSPTMLGEGEFLSAYTKILLRKQEVGGLFHRLEKPSIRDCRSPAKTIHEDTRSRTVFFRLVSCEFVDRSGPDGKK